MTPLRTLSQTPHPPCSLLLFLLDRLLPWLPGVAPVVPEWPIEAVVERVLAAFPGAVVIVVVVDVPHTAVVGGNSKDGAQEAKRRMCHGVHGEEKRGQVVAQRSLQDGLKRMHGVLGKRAWLLELVMDAVHVVPQERHIMQPAVGPVKPDAVEKSGIREIRGGGRDRARTNQQ